MDLYMPGLAAMDDMPPTEPSNESGADPRRRRLLFRATHRGTKEADLMVGGFVARHLEGFTDAELDAVEAALDHPDVDLSDWLSGRRPVDDDARSPMLDRMVAETLGR